MDIFEDSADLDNKKTSYRCAAPRISSHYLRAVVTVFLAGKYRRCTPERGWKRLRASQESMVELKSMRLFPFSICSKSLWDLIWYNVREAFLSLVTKCGISVFLLQFVMLLLIRTVYPKVQHAERVLGSMVSSLVHRRFVPIWRIEILSPNRVHRPLLRTSALTCLNKERVQRRGGYGKVLCFFRVI